jgi:Dyp-type peroxidase family
MSMAPTKPIDRLSPEAIPLLKDLQGNILVGHGRDHSSLLFLQFRSSPAALSEAKRWIQKFAEERVTSASRQLQEREDYRTLKIPGGLFGNFLLTSQGYRTLGIGNSPNDERFVAGMKTSQAELADPDPRTWDEGYKDDIHALILLAHHHESDLDREVYKILQEIREFSDVVAAERGRTMRNEHGEPIEHFGYVDGRSQPLFLIDEIDNERKKELGVVKYDPSAGPDLVLVPDPHGKKEVSFGSYFVFRKLEQNVRGFKEAEQELAVALGLTGEDEERAGALAVGRFEDGSPVVLRGTMGLLDPVPNNFSYDEDPQGSRCPFHAHIRKVNPRGETVDPTASEEERNVQLAKERSHRIVRRGIPYGTRSKEPKDNPSKEELPTKDVGLLFMCFQSSIANQFEFMQKQWAKDQDPQRKTGIDPLIGQATDQAAPQLWPTTWGGGYRKPFSFAAVVTLKGGEYFFAPSISGLVTISATP